MFLSNIDPDKLIRENKYVVVTIDPSAKRTEWSTTILITCFAYTLIYTTKDGHEKIVLGHAGGGGTIVIDDIADEIKNDLDELTEVTISIGDASIDQNALTEAYIEAAGRKFLEHFDFKPEQINIKTCCALYRIDNHGNHGLNILANQFATLKRDRKKETSDKTTDTAKRSKGEEDQQKKDRERQSFVKATAAQPSPDTRYQKPMKRNSKEMKPRK